MNNKAADTSCNPFVLLAGLNKISGPGLISRLAMVLILSLCTVGRSYAEDDADSRKAAWLWTVPSPSVSVKTNLAGWALALINIEPEYEFAKDWSFNLPLYYSAWNYGHTYRKFRGISILPGFRRYLTLPCDCCPARFWIGAHAGIMWYNYASGRNHDRYQDHDGTCPAVGGGLDVGVRIRFRKGSPWSVEFGAGAGYYRLHYDIWRNGGCGEKLGERRESKFLPDYLVASICYTFRLGGKRK